jgi:hypothetical protein
MTRPRRCWQCRRWCLMRDPGPCTRCVSIMLVQAEVLAEKITDALVQQFSIERVGRGRTH